MLRNPIHKTLVMVLAGGRGSRLMPLTEDRAKPAVPFGGRYRMVDFVLSNLVNSGFFQIVVLTQYKSQSLTRHIGRAWRLSRALDQFVEIVPAQQRTGLAWYKGSADAIYQSLNLIGDADPEYVAVFGADHVYKMNVSAMLEYHIEAGAALTIAAIAMPSAEAHAFGVIEVDENFRIIGFAEKPERPAQIPSRPGWSLVSMGNYFFSRETLVEAITEDATLEGSTHDFGGDIIPRVLASGQACYVYDYGTNVVPGQSERERGYWRDIGTIDSYFAASMDLIAVTPVMDLYNRSWPILTDFQNLAPAKFVHADVGRTGMATDSMVCEGVIISGGQTARSLLSPQVRVHSFSHLEECILFDGVSVGRHAVLRRVIVDKGVNIPPGTEIGVDHDADRARGLTVSEGGVVVVPKTQVFG
jgi:glucose-1-phosphate adenylyltransferase